ncbi:SRPBCC family protein [Nocardia thailandica]
MSAPTVHRIIEAPPEDVYAVLADGWSFVGWVVGASHIRDVDENWPEIGSRIHHSVGLWPLTVDDSTSVTYADRPRRLALHGRLWPFGAADIRFDLRPAGPGETAVSMSEEVVRGPGRYLPRRVQALLLGARNRETLDRLADIAVGRHAAGRA